MKVHPDCLPCFFKQTVIALKQGTKDGRLQEKVIKGVLEEIERADLSKSPAHATTFMHRRIRQVLGRDPFKKVKSDYNRIAMKSYPRLSRFAAGSRDPLFTAARLAIAGNIIDFGIFTSIDIDATVERALQGAIACDDYADFKRAVRGARGDILYLADNAGEIVFDRILIESLGNMGRKVIVAVKGGPVLNDATLEDAASAGITEICRVVDNGSDCVGTILPMTSAGFRKVYRDAGLVISKGQGNFETLLEEKKHIFFLFQSKCEVVSRELGLPLKSMLLKRAENW
ncbi:MAG: ARMT1-like domain-containing protein [Nitrospiraceae bacterium]|nr:ARMT1-like domain-containing protein [Nitrospiraceae bacterium]MDA8326716.1 ARMT1-like domain-containing protein [Nitrospiraceae bacterium]